MLAELSLEPECRRGHGAVYDAVYAGRVQVARLRRALAAALPARPADPGPGPPRVPEHPPDAALPGQRAETRQTRPRTPARIEEPAPGYLP